VPPPSPTALLIPPSRAAPEPAFRLPQAPTSRASCKTCGCPIQEDTVRCGEKVKSPWHDGFDVRWNHAKCLVPAQGRRGSTCHDFKGLQRLRWSDQVRIVEMLGGSVGTDAETRRIARLNEMVWEVKALLAKTPKKVLFELLDANGVFHSLKATPVGMVHGVADGLVQRRALSPARGHC